MCWNSSQLRVHCRRSVSGELRDKREEKFFFLAVSLRCSPTSWTLEADNSSWYTCIVHSLETKYLSFCSLKACWACLRGLSFLWEPRLQLNAEENEAKTTSHSWTSPQQIGGDWGRSWCYDGRWPWNKQTVWAHKSFTWKTIRVGSLCTRLSYSWLWKADTLIIDQGVLFLMLIEVLLGKALGVARGEGGLEGHT